MNNINIKDLVNLLLKNLVVILIAAIICGVGAFLYCKNFADEKYMSKGSILVTSTSITDSDRVDNGQVAASINLLSTIRDLLVTPGIYEQVSDKLNNKYTAGQLMGAAKIISNDDKTLIIEISFTLGNKADAEAVTNTFLNTAPGYISSYIDASRTSVTAPAKAAVKTAPRTLQTTVMFAFLGAVLCYAVFFVISIFNSTIRSEEDFSEHYDIPVLGNIPDITATTNVKKSSSKNK